MAIAPAKDSAMLEAFPAIPVMFPKPNQVKPPSWEFQGGSGLPCSQKWGNDGAELDAHLWLKSSPVGDWGCLGGVVLK